MQLLELSQIVFNFTTIFAIVITTVVFCMVAYEIIMVLKSAKRFFNGLTEKSEDIYRNANVMIASMPIVSFIAKLFKKNKNKNK